MEEGARGWAWVRAFWRALRPAFWAVSVFPLYMGWMLATRELFPGLDVLLALAQDAGRGGVSPGEALAAGWAWLGAAWPFVAAMACVGPLLGGATLLYNNLTDLQADRANPRRARDPHVLGLVTERQSLWGARALGAAGLLLGATLGWVFLAFMAAIAFLAWAYSAPPIHAKGRPGLDVAVNVLGIGVLCTFAGWSLGAPLAGFPWPFMVLPVLLLASTYIPTTLVDYPTDRAFGIQTLCVRLGPERTFWLGFAFAVASNLVFLLASLWDYVVPWAVYQYVWPASVAELVAYLGLRHWRDLRRFLASLVLAVASFGAGLAVFVLHHTGWLVLA